MKTLRQFHATHSRDAILLWSGLLFFIFPLAGEVIVWMSFQILGLSLAQERVWPGADHYGVYAVILLPRIVSYLLIRRLGHPPALTIVAVLDCRGRNRHWLRACSGAFRLDVLVPVGNYCRLNFLDDRAGMVCEKECRRYRSGTRCCSYAWLQPCMFPAASFRPSSWQGPSFASPLSTYLVLLMCGVLLKGTAVWAMVNTQYVVSSTRTVLPTVMAVLLVGSAFTPVLPSLWDHRDQVSWISGILSVVASGLIYSALITALAYVVRTREPRSPSPATSHSA